VVVVVAVDGDDPVEGERPVVEDDAVDELECDAAFWEELEPPSRARLVTTTPATRMATAATAPRAATDVRRRAGVLALMMGRSDCGRTAGSRHPGSRWHPDQVDLGA
jgi:hypothetical protein